MKSTTRTPAWSASPTSVFDYWKWRVTDRSGRALALVLTENDANLIAAAPELLEKLTRCKNWLSSYPGDGADSMLQEVRAVIAKAEGRE